MSTYVTIPTANYVHEIGPNSTTDTLNAQCKLWRFYCTSLDLGCPNYKLADDRRYPPTFMRNSEKTDRQVYLLWVDGWKKHYADLSDLIREHKRARRLDWFNHKDQAGYRQYLKDVIFKGKSGDFVSDYNLFIYNQNRLITRIDLLKKSAQHLLNARYLYKLASAEAMRRGKAKIDFLIENDPCLDKNRQAA